ncbi:unnamed protein product [Wuchereria bancrofti]|uniref:Uncharacterized protein n=1 Tax=Wuchereria bancrofti TaxID=6293 RepID=A0A3P7DUZ7_WUCBA|nr:unnamed protein product [Wuchereria bancrofti]
MHLPGSEQSAIPIYFHQLILSSNDTSSQHGNAEQSNIDNKYFSNNLNILDYRGNTDGESKTGNDELQLTENQKQVMMNCITTFHSISYSSLLPSTE